MIDAELRTPGKGWAYVAAVVGFMLLLIGIVAGGAYLFGSARGQEALGAQMASVAGMYLGLVCGGLALYHGIASIRNRPSGRLGLPPFYFFWILFAITLGIGNLLLAFRVAVQFLFPPLFLLGAGLPTCSVIAWASRRLGAPITWRQGALALVAGSTLSLLVVMILEGIMPFLVYLFFPPLRFLGWMSSEVMAAGQPDLLARILTSPLVIVFLAMTAIQAPLPEEFGKALGVILFGRGRVATAQQVFMLGLACGAGFAIMENMLYESLYAYEHNWSWGGITLLRGLGTVLHPLCTGLVALGWFRAREHGWIELLKAYGAAVGLHTLWNGGFTALVFFSGVSLYRQAGIVVNVYGAEIQVLLVLYLVLLAGALWMLFHRMLESLGRSSAPYFAPFIVSRRAVAAWAAACALVLIPLGALLSPAWNSIRAVLLP